MVQVETRKPALLVYNVNNFLQLSDTLRQVNTKLFWMFPAAGRNSNRLQDNQSGAVFCDLTVKK